MSKLPHSDDADQASTSVYTPAWVTVTWVNPQLRGGIQRDGTPVADMWPVVRRNNPKLQSDPEADRGGGTVNTRSRHVPGPGRANLFSLKRSQKHDAIPSAGAW